MSPRAALALLLLLLLLAGVSLADAQIKIPPNELPGRERERFFDTPGMRLDRGPPYVIGVPTDALPQPRKPCRKNRHGRNRC